MASTLDLDRLTAAAGRPRRRSCWSGTPARSASSTAPAGCSLPSPTPDTASSLEQIHRFSQDWERHASLQLRAGSPSACPDYLAEGRLHPCPDSDTALTGVFAHWTEARPRGRTR